MYSQKQIYNPVNSTSNNYTSAGGGSKFNVLTPIPIDRDMMNQKAQRASNTTPILLRSLYEKGVYAGSKYDSDPMISFQKAMASPNMQMSYQRPFRTPDDHFNMIQAQQTANFQMGNTGYVSGDQQRLEDFVKDENALWTIGRLLEIPKPQGLELEERIPEDQDKINDIMDFLEGLLRFIWWIFTGDPNKKQQFISELEKFAYIPSPNVNFNTLRVAWSNLVGQSVKQMGYSRLNGMEYKALELISLLMKCQFPATILIKTLGNVLKMFGLNSLDFIYTILEAFVKILISTRSKILIELFHDLFVELGMNNVKGMTDTSIKSTFYKAFSRLQNEVNNQKQSVFYLTDDGNLVFRSSKSMSVEEEAIAEEEGRMDPDTAERLRLKGDVERPV